MLAGLPLQNLYLLPILCIPGLSYLCSNIDVSLFGSDGIEKKCCTEFWDSLCKLKCVGGHGLKIAGDFNQALIEKLARMLAEENSKGWVKMRRSKY